MAGQTSIESFDENQMTACERRKMCTCDFDGPCFKKQIVKKKCVKESAALEEKSESSHLDPNIVSKSDIITKITDYFQRQSSATMLDQSIVKSKGPSDPKNMFISTKNQSIHAPNIKSLGCHVGLKFIEDESMFDLDSLTCHACNDKIFKNAKAFKIHRDRHQGVLNQKCPECSKTFSSRSEVHRHLVAIHRRPLADKGHPQQKSRFGPETCNGN
jgi:hypothetical protein